MAESLKPEWSHVRLICRIQPRTVTRPSSAQVLDRIIDVAIVVFLICSVVSITAAQAAILVAQAAWLVKLVRAPNDRVLHFPLLLPMATFYLASVLASATAMDPWLSFKDLRNIFEPVFFFLLVNHLSGDERATTFSYILIAAATLMAVYGLTQSMAEGAAFRVHGTMSIYMTFAGILMLSALVVMAQLLFFPRGRWIWGLVGSLALLIAALVMTHTRGAWIGFAAGGALILGCRQKRLLLALPVVAVAIFLAAPEAVRVRIRSIIDPQDVTARERLYMWGSGVQIVRDHPWTGVGINGVKGVYQAYKHPNAVRDQRAHLHSNLFQIAAERGLIGVACWLWIWVAFYRQAWIIFRGLKPGTPRASALVVGSLASITGFHVAGLFEFTFGDSEVIMLVYFLMALPYVVMGVDRKARVHGTEV
jgi:putative inorganic carbon (HCO3(-)) transporter